ncbi:MAG: EAL domain-containing protein [Acidobacteriota bacterium]
MKWPAVLSLLLLFAAAAAANDELRLRRLGLEQGLAQSSVQAIAQDRYGFLWLATQDGLHRWDGRRFTVFALGHRRVLALLEGDDGRLWIGGQNGLSAYDPSTGRFHAPTMPDGPAPSIHALAEHRGVVWALADDGVLRVVDGRLERLPAASFASESLGLDPEGLEEAWRGVLAVAATAGDDTAEGDAADDDAAESDGQSLWLGHAGGLARWNGSAFEPVSGLDAVEVTALAPARGGGLWVGDGAGRVSRVGVGPPRPVEGLGAERAGAVSVLLEDSAGRLWVGRRGGGLDLLPAPDDTVVRLRHRPLDASSLSAGSVEALYEDRGGLLWVGTALGGATRIDPRPRAGHVMHRPGVAESLPAGAVRAFARDADGAVWVGVDGGGARRLDGAPSTGAYRAPIDHPVFRDARVRSLLVDRTGALWIGAETGLARWTADRKVEWLRPVPGDPLSLPPGGVRALAEDADGRVWVGTFGGGLAVHVGELGFRTEMQHSRTRWALPDQRVLSLLVDSRGTLWVGTAGGLARRGGDGRFHTYLPRPQDPTSLRGSLVQALHQSADGDLWVGTEAGLNRLSAELVEAPPSAGTVARGFRHFDSDDGLPDDSVHGILEDAAGRLWVSTSRGMARVDPERGEVVRLDVDDGLQGLEFSDGAALRVEDALFFGGVGGFNVLEPERLEVNRHAPPVVVTAIESAGESLELSAPPWALNTIDLPYDAAGVSLRFAALDFAEPEDNRFEYSIEGLDDGWRGLGTRDEVVLGHLGAGSYTLRVRAANGDGVWNEEGVALALHRQPAPWRTWWAWAGYLAVASLLLGVLVWQAWRRLRLEAQVVDVVRTSERRLDSALRGSGDGLWDWNLESGEIFRSHIGQLLGWASDDLPPGEAFRDFLIHPDDRVRVEQAMQAHLHGETPRYEVELRMKTRGGPWRWILDRGTTIERDDDGEPLRVAGTFRDITRSKQVEDELRVWSTVFESLGEGVVVIGGDDRVLAVNPAYGRMTGAESAELVGRPAGSLGVENDEAPTWNEIRRRVEAEGRWQGEVLQARVHGGAFLAALDVTRVRATEPEASRDAKRRFVMVVVDITRRKESEEELRYLASYDTLTELPNRAMFQQQIVAALERAADRDRRVALLFSDLDRFKQVNDTLGHVAGDLLLQEAAARLLASVRSRDGVARLGGDEFTVVLEDVPGRDKVEQVARRILEAFDHPFVLDGHEVSVTASLGIALYPEHGDDADTLLKHADVAMYAAKAAGRDRFRFYEPAMSERVLERLTLESSLRRAVEADELELWHQPQLDLAAGRLSGVECLLRWRRDGEILAPGDFLEIADETGLIVSLGAWTLDTACRRGAAGARRGLDVAVNVSAAQIEDPAFVELVESSLEAHGMPAEHLVLELGESLLTRDDEVVPQRLEELAALGVRLALDDFGTGFSSFGRLEKLPLHQLKIDMSFVRDVGTGEAPIFHAILGMARGFGLRVVAEGVETEAQMRVLAGEVRCIVQGYLVAPPRPVEEFDELLGRDDPPWRAWLTDDEASDARPLDRR